VEPGEPAFITLYWQASDPLAADLRASVQVIAGPGSEVKFAQADQLLGTGSFPDYPPDRWRPGQVVRDRYLIVIPDDTAAPQSLTLLAAAYHGDTGQRVGERSFGALPVTYARPLEVPPEAEAVGARVGPATLAAYSAQVNAGVLTVTLYWSAGEPMAEDAIVFLHLLDADGQLALGQDEPPRNGLYSTRAWQPGEGVVDEHRLSLPADLPPGEYRIEVGMYDAETQARLPVLDAAGQPVPDGVVRLGEAALE
jgi:hypothetical protein